MSLKRMIEWPKTPRNNYVPLAVMVWRFPWLMLGNCFRAGTAFCILMGFGLQTAREFWKDSE